MKGEVVIICGRRYVVTGGAITKPKLRLATSPMHEIRLRLGLTGRRFATLLGVTSQSVSNWEAGVHHPHPATVRAALALLSSPAEVDCA